MRARFEKLRERIAYLEFGTPYEQRKWRQEVVDALEELYELIIRTSSNMAAEDE
jgi:hypothetical protein